MAEWAYVLASPQGAQLGELTGAGSRKLTVSVDSHASASCELAGDAEQAYLISELATDLIVYRDGDRLFRGRVGPTTDTVTADGHRVTVNAHDYRALLDRRILHNPISFNQVDQEAIGWGLITATQQMPGGNLGITRGAGQATGVLRDRTDYEPGKPVGEALTQLSEVINGFEWHIDPDLVYRVHYPRRGANRGYILDFGGTAAAVTRNIDPGRYANAVRVTGDDTTTPVVRTAADIAAAATGRFDLVEAISDVSEQSTLAQRADRLLADSDQLIPAYTVTLTPGVWKGRGDLWAGDTVHVVLRSGRLDEQAAVRAADLNVAISDDGVETVSVTARTTSFRQRIYALDRRLGALERAQSG